MAGIKFWEEKGILKSGEGPINQKVERDLGLLLLTFAKAKMYLRDFDCAS